MSAPLLGRRFRYDGRPASPLTATQRQAADQVRGFLRSGELKVEAVACPACDGPGGEPISEKETYGLPVRTVLCQRCGLAFSNPRLTGESLHRFYSAYYRNLDRAIPDPAQFVSFQAQKGPILLGFLREQGLDFKTPGRRPRVVEIGCGAGGILHALEGQGFDCVGCDFDETYLEQGRRNAKLKLYQGDLARLAEAGEFSVPPDLVIYEQVLEHLPDPKAEMHRLRELLSPDSIVFIGVPGMRNVDRHYGSDLLRYLQLPHLLHFDLGTLERMMNACGFELIGGNEIVRAAFRLSRGGERRPRPYRQSTYAFLRAMERRFQAKRAVGFGLRAARALKRRIGRALSR